MIPMSAQQQLKLDVVLRFLSEKISRKSAEELLRVSSDTFRRYLRSYEKKSFLFVEHGNKGKVPKNKTPAALQKQVVELWQKKYFDCNIIHFQEKLLADHGLKVNRETLRHWAHEFHLLKRSQRRSPKARFLRDRMARPGLLLQMDGSKHLWFGNEKSVLIAVIDDATSEVYHAEFFDSEDTTNCMKVIQSVIKKRGLFQALYVDRAGIYGGTKRQQFSQLKRACEEVGVSVFFAQSAQAKGRIERLFRTLQDRLIPELRLRNITSMKMANWYLGQDFLPNIHQPKFTVPPEKPQSAFRPIDRNLDLTQIFCLKELRIINLDHTIQYNNHVFALKLPFKQSIAHQAVEVREYPNGSFKTFWRGMPIQVDLVKKYSRPFPEIPMSP